MTCTILPHLAGGLGNWLFQVAAAVKFAQDLGVQYCLVKEKAHRSPHSSTDYFSTILSKFNQRDTFRSEGVVQIVEPANFNHLDYRAMISPLCRRGVGIDVYLVGYFQHHEFVPRTFKHMLSLPSIDCSKVRDTCFIHIRGGDFLTIPLHNINLDSYYRKSVAHMKSLGITKFSVFTNDKPHALRHEFLNDVEYEFVDAPEIDSLVLMSECRAGICANSSFSWWGAYLNPNRPICMPSKWFNSGDINTSGYYFPGECVSLIDI
jgi:hypothetical protein